jgi:hypothetical protein
MAVCNRCLHILLVDAEIWRQTKTMSPKTPASSRSDFLPPALEATWVECLVACPHSFSCGRQRHVLTWIRRCRVRWQMAVGQNVDAGAGKGFGPWLSWDEGRGTGEREKEGSAGR